LEEEKEDRAREGKEGMKKGSAEEEQKEFGTGCRDN
jgi:hypothetical protein